MGSLVGAGLYFSNLVYVTAGDESARAAARASAAAIARASAVARQARIVTISNAAAASPKALDVLGLLSKYFDAINTKNYAEFSSTQNQAGIADQPKASFDLGYSTTTDSHEVITTITATGASTLTATVLFTSHQSPSDSIDSSSCNDWTLNLYIAEHGSRYLITPAPPSYEPTYTDC
jgi:hypothetical protein